MLVSEKQEKTGDNIVMIMVRSNTQVVIHKLLSGLINSRNYYETVSKSPGLSEYQHTFSTIVSDRSAQIGLLRQLIRKEGELPSEGNDDLSDAAGLGTMFEAAISENPLKSVLERCIATEEVLRSLSIECIEGLSESDTRNQIRDVDRHIVQTSEFLQSQLDR